jgi:hypothetical protein
MTNPSMCSRHSAYYEAVQAADDDVKEALGHIAAEQNAGRLSTAEAVRGDRGARGWSRLGGTSRSGVTGTPSGPAACPTRSPAPSPPA